MGHCLSKTSKDVILPIVDYINHFTELRFKFPSINNHDDFKKFMLNAIVYPTQYKFIKDYLKSEHFIDDNDMLTTTLKPFNLFSRIVDGNVLNKLTQSNN